MRRVLFLHACPPSHSGPRSHPAPKTASCKPDFSGLWQVNFQRGTSGVRIFTDAEGTQMMKPEGAELYARRQRNFWADDNPAHCLPLGIARYLGGTQRIAQATIYC